MFKNSWKWLLGQLKHLVTFRNEKTMSFSYGGFIGSYLLQFAVVMIIVLPICYLINPPTFFVQVNNPFDAAHFGWWLGTKFFMSGFEWGYHRYVLHSIFWWLLRAQCVEHTRHHTHTDVTNLTNKYPIVEPHQNESATFPFYAPMAFSAVFMPGIVPLQIMNPSSPVMVGCIIGIFSSLVFYEVYHAVMHLKYEKHWKESVEKSRIIRRIYGFHLIHHVYRRMNQAIAGFFFFPIWDWIFGTYFVPVDCLPLPGEPAPSRPKPPKPRRIVRAMDKIVNAVDVKLRKKYGSPSA